MHGAILKVVPVENDGILIANAGRLVKQLKSDQPTSFPHPSVIAGVSQISRGPARQIRHLGVELRITALQALLLAIANPTKAH